MKLLDSALLNLVVDSTSVELVVKTEEEVEESNEVVKSEETVNAVFLD